MDGNELFFVKEEIENLFNTIKEITQTAIQEREETARVEAKTKALIKMNENQCKTIIKVCEDFNKGYLKALKADAESQKYFREKAHELIMYYVVRGVEPPTVIENYINKYLECAVSSANVKSLPNTIEKSLDKLNMPPLGVYHKGERYLE